MHPSGSPHAWSPLAVPRTCSCTSASRHVCHPQTFQSAAPSGLVPTWRWHRRSARGKRGKSEKPLMKGTRSSQGWTRAEQRGRVERLSSIRRLTRGASCSQDPGCLWLSHRQRCSSEHGVGSKPWNAAAIAWTSEAASQRLGRPQFKTTAPYHRLHFPPTNRHSLQQT